MSAPIGERTRLDAALDALAAVGRRADELGDRMRRASPSTPQSVAASRPVAVSGDAVIGALFDLEPRAVDSDYDLAFATRRPREARARRRVHRPARRGRRAPAPRRDADAHPPPRRGRGERARRPIDAAARAAPTDAGGVYAMAAALDALAVREAAVANLTGVARPGGAGPADSLPARCVGATYDSSRGRGSDRTGRRRPSGAPPCGDGLGHRPGSGPLATRPAPRRRGQDQPDGDRSGGGPSRWS